MKALALVGLVVWLSPAVAFLAWVAYERWAEKRVERTWAEFVEAHRWEVPA